MEPSSLPADMANACWIIWGVQSLGKGFPPAIRFIARTVCSCVATKFGHTNLTPPASPSAEPPAPSMLRFCFPPTFCVNAELLVSSNGPAPAPLPLALPLRACDSDFAFAIPLICALVSKTFSGFMSMVPNCPAPAEGPAPCCCCTDWAMGPDPWPPPGE